MKIVSQTAKHRRAFTLIEIMVAMAMLVIMMSFLFEFVISSQRLWTASEKKSQSFNDGQMVLDVVGEDIRNMDFRSEIDKCVPFLRIFEYKHNAQIDVNDEKNQTFSFYVLVPQYKSSNSGTGTEEEKKLNYVGMYPVVYVHCKDIRKLYRFELDRKDPYGVTLNPWEFYGIDFINASNNAAMNSKIDAFVASLALLPAKAKQSELLASNVWRFDILGNKEDSDLYKSHTTGGNIKVWLAAEKPRSMRMIMDIVDWNSEVEEQYIACTTDAERDAVLEGYSRNFSKTVYIH